MFGATLVALVCLCLVTRVWHVPNTAITCWQLVIGVSSSSVQFVSAGGKESVVMPGHWFVSDTHPTAVSCTITCARCNVCACAVLVVSELGKGCLAGLLLFARST